MLQDIAQQLKHEEQKTCGQRHNGLKEVLVASYANDGINKYTNVHISVGCEFAEMVMAKPHPQRTLLQSQQSESNGSRFLFSFASFTGICCEQNVFLLQLLLCIKSPQMSKRSKVGHYSTVALLREFHWFNLPRLQILRVKCYTVCLW